jgi:phosphoglycolate phosphatase
MDGLIFDVDGTIWNSTGIVAEAWNAAIEETGADADKVTAEILKGQFGKMMNVIGDNLFPRVPEGKERENLLRLCEAKEEKALAENERDISYPGLKETMKKLSEIPGLKLFIVSNCQSGYIELVMEKTGIAEYITDFICYGDNKLPKNENIKIIVERNGLKDPYYVGDIDGDRIASEAARVPFIHAAYGFGVVEKYDYKVDDITELVDIAKRQLE